MNHHPQHPPATNTQQLPTLGGPFTHSLQEINERAVAMSIAYVDSDHAADFLSMDWQQTAAMMLGNFEAVQGMHRVRYDRTRFIVQINDGEPAWADVLVAIDYTPTNEDVRWLLNSLADSISLCLAGGADSPQGIWARALSRLMPGSVNLELISADAADFPDIDSAFQRANGASGIDWSTAEAAASGAAQSWREFFNEIDQVVQAIVSGAGFDEARDGDEIAAGPEVCWRCEARFAKSTIGLCEECSIDLKADA